MSATERASRARVWPLWPVVCVALTTMTVYLTTMPPSLTWSHWGTDGGDFVTAAVTGRVPHPPGFPVYYLLSRVAVTLPGDPARILNALSALMAAGAAAIAAATALKRGLASWTAVAAGLTLGFSPWLWSQAVITEVYTTAALFCSLTLFLGEVARDGLRSTWLLVGLGLGAAVAVHPTTALMLLPVALGAQVSWGWLALGMMLGLSPYALLPLFGTWPQPWGDLRSLDGWLEYVSGRQYWGNAFGLPVNYWSSRALAGLVHVLRQFTPVGAVLAIWAIARGWHTERAKTAGVLVALVGALVYAIGYDSADSWVYLVPYLPVAALALGSGIESLSHTGVPAALGLVLPAALLVLNWGHIDLRSDREAVEWLSMVADQVPDGAVVVTQTDQHTFALWYYVGGPKRGPDLQVVDRRLWGYAPYNAYLTREGLDASRAESYEDIRQLVAGRAFCEVDSEGGVVCSER